MNERSSLSSAHNIVPNLRRVVGHGDARIRHRLINAWPTGPVLSTAYSRQVRRRTKQLCAASNRPIKPQPRQVKTIVANIAAKSP